MHLTKVNQKGSHLVIQSMAIKELTSFAAVTAINSFL